MIEVYALSLIYDVRTEEEIEILEGKEYLQKVLDKKDELLQKM